ncbi:MAG: hypothetical protein ACIAZJ_00750 [Gimesia chilikensis]|uniref:hypothetical protein n=1 Tax=Gimesia chilikensis TaxID=2605989 RepID=UPI00378743D0
MNLEHDKSPTEPSDESIRELLSPLQELQPSEEQRAVIRQAVSARLEESTRQQIDPASLRNQTARTLCAMACTLLMGIGIGWMLRGADQESKTVTTVESPASATDQRETDRGASITNSSVATTDLTSSNYVSETYLCGVGILSTRSEQILQENP